MIYSTTKIEKGIYRLKVNNHSFLIVSCAEHIMDSTDKWHVYKDNGSGDFETECLTLSAPTKKVAIEWIKEDFENGFLK